MSLVILQGSDEIIALRVGRLLYCLEGNRLYRYLGKDTSTIQLAEHEKLPSSDIEDEYRWLFSARGIQVGHDPDYKLQTGNYKGKTLDEVVKVEPNYLVSKTAKYFYSDDGDSCVSYTKERVALNMIYAHRHNIMKAAPAGSLLANAQWWMSLGSFNNYASPEARAKLSAQMESLMCIKCPELNCFDFTAIHNSKEKREDMYRCIDFLNVRKRCILCGLKLGEEYTSSLHFKCVAKLKPRKDMELGDYLA
jgi:hypothetical protein